MDDVFQNRESAGRKLAEAVQELGLKDPVVYALPRGGVPVALPVAEALDAPLDLLLVRKIGAPGQEELAMGAVVDGEAPEVVWNDQVVDMLRVSEADKRRAVKRKLAEIEKRRSSYLGDRAPVPVEGRDAVVVDDGIATGATTRAALLALRRRKPASITLAVPVAPEDSLSVIEPDLDHVVCLSKPHPFYAVGAHYADFRQTTDDEVTRALASREGEQNEP